MGNPGTQENLDAKLYLSPTPMSTLERAIQIAASAHQGQLDKAGEPYVLHPLRIMLTLEDEKERIVAALHDVVEDSEWTLESLKHEGFSENVLDAIDSVTRRKGESYEAFVARSAEHPIGRRVKLADLADNANLSRIRNPTKEDRARRQKYLTAIDTILQRCEDDE